MQLREDQFNLRLPDGWRDALKNRAARNRRSMNSEILAALESVVGSAAGEELPTTAPAAAINQGSGSSSDEYAD